MIASKNNSGIFTSYQSGFTLIEVLLSVAIVGLVLTPILMLQSMIVRNTGKHTNNLIRIYEAKKFLLDSEISLAPGVDHATQEKKITKPPATLVYEYNKVSQESALKKFKNIYRQMVTIQWRDQSGKHQDRIVLYTYKPESKKT